MDNIPKPIKDLGKKSFSKVADKFVDFVIYKYTGKSIKVFEAEGDIEADKVKSRWELLEKPFWLEAEARKMNREYTNWGNSLAKSTPFITATENNIEEDNDVFWGLLEHTKEISNDEMQELIAKIIAGEYNAPGTYSMSMLQVIKMLGKSEIELFEKMCSLLVNGTQIPKSLFSLPKKEVKIMKDLSLDFGSLQLLQSLSLFFPNEMSKTQKNPEGNNLRIIYFDKSIIFSPVSTENVDSLKIKIPAFFGLSPVGEQLLEHLNPIFNESYYYWLQENYKIPNYKLVD